MNFLAHIFLSFGDEEVTLGNFIADNIQGNKYKHFPPGIQKGILLHREIDTYTDSHPIPKISSKRLHIPYGHYSRVIIDIYYDHFLAKNWVRYSEVPLDIFVNRFYALLQDNYALLPDRVKHMLPYMITENWIYNYGNLEGIDRVLHGMDRRTQNKSKMSHAISELRTDYGKYEAEFTAFFEELIIFSKMKYASL